MPSRMSRQMQRARWLVWREMAKTEPVIQIAKRDGVSRDAVYKALAALRANVPVRVTIPPEDIIAAFRDEGLSGAEVGRRFGVSRQYVYHVVKEAGLAHLTAQRKQRKGVDAP